MTERNAKDKWPIVAFGDVAKQVKDKVSPADSGLDRYIAGEHMDTDDLRIRRWGIIGNDYLGPAFHMRFKPGQILYGSRRTYLRKVAVADFEGITANTTFVIESKDPAILLPELLPFIMQTESFHAFSIKQSKGSTNPYVNFSDLVEYEFALPPMDDQRRIVEVLQSAYTYKEKLQNVQECLIFTLDSIALHAMDSHASPSSISEYCDVNPDSLTSLQLSSNEIWNYVDLSSVSFPMQIGEMQSVRLSEAPSRARRISLNGDILVSTVRPNLRGHAIVSDVDSDIVVSTGFTVLRPKMGSYKNIIMGLILSSRFLQYCEGRIAGTSYPAINSKDVSGFPVPDILALENKGYEVVFESLFKNVSKLWVGRKSDYQKFSQYLFGEIFPA